MAQKAQVFEVLLAGLEFADDRLSGGKVYFYEPGTETLKSVYLDRNKTTEASNPYTLDSNGQAQVYGDGVYDVKVTDSGGTQKAFWEDVVLNDASSLFTFLDVDGFYDKITDIGSTPTTLFVTVDQTITTAVVVPDTIDLVMLNNSKLNLSGSGEITGLRYAKPEWFGADTGEANNAAAFTNALKAVGEGGSIFVSKGTWNITATITTAAAYQTVQGEGWGSIINQTSTAANKGGISTAYDGLRVTNIQIKSPTQVGNENIAISAVKGDVSAISDITVDHCYLNGFSYGVAITNATRPRVHNNYIYSTGDNSTDQGGALQVSQIVDGHIVDNTISGDPNNRFQHGAYLAGDIDGLVFSRNIIKDGFWSYGLHIYGSTFVNGRKNLIVDSNIITNTNGGIIISRDTAGTGPTSDVRITGNIVKVADRGFIAQADTLNNILVQGNYFESGGNAVTNFIFAIIQGTGEELDGFQVLQNTFKNFKNGGLDINNALSMKGLTISDNTFIADAAGLSVLTMDDPSASGYTSLTITNNKYAGQYPVIVSPTNYSGWRNASWMTMFGNSWDVGLHEKVTRVTTTPYALADTDQVIWVTTGASTITIDLPTIIGHLDGRKVTVCKIDSGAGTVVIEPNSTQLINGASNYTLTARWQTVVFQAVNGSAWVIVGTN